MSLSNWIKWSKADYYVLFVKAWIPFNAWYHKTYYDEISCKYDKNMIIKVKTMDNPYKQKLKNLLTATGEEADMFRFHLAHLYHELELHTVPNANERLSFNTIWADENNLDAAVVEYGQKKYVFSRIASPPPGGKKFKIEIQKKVDGTTKAMIELFKKDMVELTTHPDYQPLNETDKEKVRECLTNVLRHKPAGIVKQPKANGGKPSHAIVIDSQIPLYLTDDTDLVARAVIQLLYQLRCIMFHGSLDPAVANQGIYKHAYHIQEILLKEIED